MNLKRSINKQDRMRKNLGLKHYMNKYYTKF